MSESKPHLKKTCYKWWEKADNENLDENELKKIVVP